MKSIKSHMRLAALAAAVSATTLAHAQTLEMTSVYPGTFPIIGEIGQEITTSVSWT